MNFDEDNWEAYKQANSTFADAVHEDIEEGVSKGEDILVWVQDYHLSRSICLLQLSSSTYHSLIEI